MTKTLKELLEEEEERQRIETTANVQSLENQAIQTELNRVPTDAISGVVLPDSVRNKITMYKRDQEDFDYTRGKPSTVDEFLSFYNQSGYEDFALNYAYSKGMSLQDFHNEPTDSNYWKNVYKDEDQQVLDKSNLSLICNDLVS